MSDAAPASGGEGEHAAGASKGRAGADADAAERPRASRLLAAFGVLLAVLVTAWVTRVSEGRRALAACDAAFARGDRVEAIVFARAAAEARCPGCAAPERAFTKLAAIAKDAEGRGDDLTAVSAWRAVRAATLGSVVIDTSTERRERADGEIARLEHAGHMIDAAAGVASAAGRASPTRAATEERLRAALAVNTIPSAPVFVLLTLGGALFLYGALRFVRARRLRPTELALSAAGGGLAVLAVLLF